MIAHRVLLFWIGLAIVAAASLFSIGLRYRAESRNKAYAIALEASVIKISAAQRGISFSEALAELKSKGLTMVVLNETNVRELLDTTGSSEDAIRSQYHLGNSRGSIFLSMPLGLSAEESKAITDSGLQLLARLSNTPGRPNWTLAQTITDAASKGACGLLPLGEQVPGFRGQLKELDELLKANRMFYAAAEFAKISGDSNMIASSPENVVRLHAAQTLELDRLTLGAVEERFAKAFGERSIRIMMLRPLDSGSADPLADLGDLVSKINQTLRKEGGAPGMPRPFEAPEVPTALFIAIGVGLGLATWSVLVGLGLQTLISAVISVAIVAACATGTGRIYMATLGSMIFPIAAYQFLAKRITGSILGTFLVLVGISLVGGLAVAGLLNSLKFYVRAEQFYGVKPAHFLPMFVMAWVLVSNRFDVKSMVKQPITYASLFMGLAVMGILGFMLARTGNDNPGAVSGLELKLRSLLEQFLIVRPRTKEFLVGHPALWVGLGLYFWSQKNGGKLMGVAIFLLFVGSIALTSIVNTMCHIHTPVIVGLARIAVGVVLGSIFGFIAWSVVKPMLSRWEGQQS